MREESTNRDEVGENEMGCDEGNRNLSREFIDGIVDYLSDNDGDGNDANGDGDGDGGDEQVMHLLYAIVSSDEKELRTYTEIEKIPATVGYYLRVRSDWNRIVFVFCTFRGLQTSCWRRGE
mmetsp:Transcript_35290/g.74175  ORF Transcript_35290/g.74175 Transcript_35290/m.74175 type:complete len:121 (+) Transcript_35290:1639-2001(+)